MKTIITFLKYVWRTWEEGYDRISIKTAWGLSKIINGVKE